MWDDAPALKSYTATERLGEWEMYCMIYNNATNQFSAYANTTLLGTASTHANGFADALAKLQIGKTDVNTPGKRDNLVISWDVFDNATDIPNLYSYGILDAPAETITQTYNTSWPEESENRIRILFKNYNASNTTTTVLNYNGTEYNGTLDYTNDSYIEYYADVTTPFTYFNNSNVSFYWNYTLRLNNGTNLTTNTTPINQAILWNLTKYPRVNITAYNYTGGIINTFTLNDSNKNLSTTTNDVYFWQTGNTSANITITANGYATDTKNITFTEGLFLFDNFTLFTHNSLNITIRDESTNALITENVSIRFSSDYQEWTNSTITGLFYIDLLNATEWSLFFESQNYSSRIYTLTVNNQSHQYLTAYLSANTSSTLFTVTDTDTTESLEDVLITMYRMINNSWMAIESKYTDITGRANFSYTPDVNYRFYLSKDGYDDYIFYLNPILFSEYDVQMEKTTVINQSQDYDKISIIYSPHYFYNNNYTNFTFLIQSPLGELISYGFNISYPNNFSIASGSNAIGGQLSGGVNITNAEMGDTVKLYYYYETTLAGNRNFTLYFPILFPDYANNTLIKNRDEQYGLGLFERLFVSTIVILFIVGIASLLGQVLPGLAIGLLVWGLMVYSGFIPLWSVVISLIVGVFFLFWKSGGS